MTGGQLKLEIKKLCISQEDAATRLGIHRVTLGNWFKTEELTPNQLQNVKENLGIDLAGNSGGQLSEPEMMRHLLENNNTLTETNQRLTKKIIELIDELESERKKTKNVAAASAKTASVG